MSTGGLTFEEWAAQNKKGPRPQTPMEQWQIAQAPDGSMWWYDQAGQARIQVGRDSYRTMNGQLVAVDPAGAAHVVPVQGLEPKDLTPSAEVARAKLGMEPGSVDWAGYSPTGQWTAGGVRVNLDVYDQVSILQQKIADLQAQREEMVRLSDPRFAEPGNEAADAAAMERNVAQIDKDLAGYTNQLRMVAEKNKLNLGAGVLGGRHIETAQEVYDKEAARLKARQELLQWKYDNGYEVKPADLQKLKADAEEALQRIRDAALMERQTQAQGAEQPYKQATAAREAAQLAMQRDQSRIAGLRTQMEVGQRNLNELTSAGIAPSLGSARMAMDPWMSIQRIISEGVQSGTIDPSWVPTPIAARAYPPTAPGAVGPPPAPEAPGLPPTAPIGGD